MDSDNLMTVEEFNNKVRDWTLRIKRLSKTTLDANTDSTGHLSDFPVFRDRLDYNKPYYKVKFHFERYGVFRHYGAGRGYVMVNGVPVRGYRVRSNRDISNRFFGQEARNMAKKGYSNAEINTAKITYGNQSNIRRTPLNWLDKHIDNNINHLADIAQEFYGDQALRNILRNFSNIKITKK